MSDALSGRLRRRVEADFGKAAPDAERLLRMAERGGQGHERVLAAIVLASDGHLARLAEMVELSRQDWRDALVVGGLADQDWPQVLEAELGPGTSALGVALVLAGCVVAGALQWTLWVVGRTGDDSIPLGFWLGTLLMVVVVTVGFDVEPMLVGPAFFAGPAVLALWTTPRGDNDGLWLMAVFALAGAGGIAAAVALVVRQLGPRPIRPPIAQAHLGWFAAGLVVVAIGTAVLFVDRRADPFPGLERAAAAFELPDGFVGGSVTRSGDPLCTVACGPMVEVTARVPDSAENGCAAVQRWLDESHPGAQAATEVYNPAVGYFEVCAWSIDDADAWTTVAVSDDPAGPLVRITVRPAS